MEFDGVWLTHNSISGICHGECPLGDGNVPQPSENVLTSVGDATTDWYTADPAQTKVDLEHMPFTPFPTVGQTKPKLDDKSLSLDGQHTDDFGKTYSELDIHNLNSVI